MSRKIITLTRVIKVCGVLTLVFIAVAIASVLIGPAKIGIIQGLKGLFLGWQEGYAALTPSEKTIIFSIRLPRVIFAGLVGASLSCAGVIFQALLRNPLADPFILGISGGSAVGAIIGIILGLGSVPFGIPGLAFLGAVFTVVLVFLIGKSDKELNSTTLLLAGVIVNAFFSAVIMFLISISSNADLHNIAFWLMGNLSMVSWATIAFEGILLLFGFVIIYSYARPLNLIVIGEEVAMQLGVNVERTKIVLFLAGSLITGLAVAFSGIIGFVGLIIPHIMRMLLGPDHRILLPASLLFGASFLIATDTIARTLIPHSELPVGVITALLGAPYFIYLLRRRSA
ncbi:MAG: iron chelate uptake ABC transporter family permease subunit [Thermodesulfobacteriota bacterium]|nr:iron chelate uptake ABC transporter family permease subunit [Thermodesulfobacteriota bacterium]